MAELSPKLVWRVNGEQPGDPSECLLSSIACTEVNEYMAIKYFLNNDDNFTNFRKKAKALLQKSNINKKTCGSPENTRKRKISHILETAPNYSTDYDKEGFALQNSDTNNASVIFQHFK